MKVMNLIFQIFLIFTISLILYFWCSGFKSAFEADRYCHNDLTIKANSSKGSACDHDIETHQWILYENQENSSIAKVIKRYRYRFL